MSKITHLFGITLIIVVLALEFFSCATHNDWTRLIDWKELTFADLPGFNDYPDAGAIIVLDEGKMEIIGSAELPMSLFERHQIVKILNVRGHRYSNVVIPYTPQSRVERVQARTLSPEGRITVLNPKHIYDVNLYPDYIFYSDHRAKLFTMPAVEDGAVVEYRYRMTIASRSLWPSWNFQNDVPTLKSRFTLVAPAEWELNYKLYDIDLEPIILKAPQGFKSSYTWEANQVPDLKSEFGMPPKKECVARLEIAPAGMKKWDDVAQWYHQLAASQIKAGRNIKELALKLTDGIQSNEDKLKNIYEWVRDHIRYIAVAIDIGGFQPHPAEEVLINRYGDCKDMTTLLCSLAREAGIEANEVLVSTWQNGEPDTSLPSPFQFNHAIAYCPSIGDSGVWLDATAKGCPYHELPWYDQGLPVLVVDKQGTAKLLVTPVTPSDSNRTILDWEVTLPPTGAAMVQGKTLFKGTLATEMREGLANVSPPARRQWLEIDLAKRCQGVRLDSFQITEPDPVSNQLAVSYKFHTPAFAHELSEAFTFHPIRIMAFDLPDYFRSLKRVHPIQFHSGMFIELNLKVKLPNDWQVITPASSDSIVSSFGTVSWSCIAADSNVQTHITLHLPGKIVDPQHYLDFQNFLDSLNLKLDRLEIALKKL